MPSSHPPTLQIRRRVLDRQPYYDLPVATDPLAFTPGLQQSLGQLDDISDEDINACFASIAAEQAKKNAEAGRLSRHQPPNNSSRPSLDHYDRPSSSSPTFGLGSQHSYEASGSLPHHAPYHSAYTNTTPFSLTPSPGSSYGGLPSPTHTQPSSAGLVPDSYYAHPMYSPQQQTFQTTGTQGSDLHGVILDSVQQGFVQRATIEQQQQRHQHQQYSHSFASSSSLRNALQPVPLEGYVAPEWGYSHAMGSALDPAAPLLRRSSVPTLDSTTSIDPSQTSYYPPYHRPSSETAWYHPPERPPR